MIFQWKGVENNILSNLGQDYISLTFIIVYIKRKHFSREYIFLSKYLQLYLSLYRSIHNIYKCKYIYTYIYRYMSLILLIVLISHLRITYYILLM